MNANVCTGQFSNMDEVYFRPIGRVRDLSAVHPANAPSAMVSTESGTVRPVRLVQFPKALEPMDCRPLLRARADSGAPLKAYWPMLRSVDGNVTVFAALRYE